MSHATSAVRSHVEGFFRGHAVDTALFDRGPVRRRVPDFAVVRAGAGPRNPLWTYVTLGCWDAAHLGEHGLEFVLTAVGDREYHLETLAMTAYYHAGPESQRLDLGHTVPIGRPWEPGSTCDHLLVCLPYPFGPELEKCEWASGHARLLWLLPITEAERDFKRAHGLEALEEKFDDVGLRYWEANRVSVV